MAADSTAMTIDFLRARLLSERSVSRASRERADQLAKRVAELEEQLKIVTTQRKNAEKAASEVLAILESQGFGYLTEPELIDSSSDQDEDENQEDFSPSIAITKECNNNCNSNSKEKEKEKDEVQDALSGSEMGNCATPPAGSLSWKGRSKSPDSHKKNKVRQRQRRIFYFTSPDPSPKYQLGKSCRKIKPRSEAENEGENGKFSAESNENTSTDERMGFYVQVSRDEPEPDPELQMGCDDENGESCEERTEEMERALEEQADLIGQFQAEENAQREWEKIYNETRNPSFADNIESENNESTGENSCGEKKEIVDHYVGDKSECSEEPKLNSEILSSNGSITEKHEMNSDQEITNASYEKAIVVVSDDSVLANETKSKDEMYFKEVSSVPNSPTSESNSSINHNENPLALQLYQPPADKVGDVLEALRRAKISLRENLGNKKLHLLQNQELLAITEHGEEETQHIMNIPVGNSASLFRLPTDSFPSSDLSDSVLSLEYSKDLMNRFSAEDYFDSRTAVMTLPDSSSSSSSSNRYGFGFGSSSNIGVQRFYEDLRRSIPAGDRLFLYGGECSFADLDML